MEYVILPRRRNPPTAPKANPPALFCGANGSILIPETLREIGWNQQFMKWHHFMQAVELAGIRLVERELPDDHGQFYYRKGQPVINLDIRLKRQVARFRLFVGFHELGHAFLHTPGK